MRSLVFAAALAALPASGAGTCPEVPKDKALRAEEVQARLEARGYDVRRVKREGACYEVKARKDGERVEVTVSPADGAIVREKRSR